MSVLRRRAKNYQPGYWVPLTWVPVLGVQTSGAQQSAVRACIRGWPLKTLTPQYLIKEPAIRRRPVYRSGAASGCLVCEDIFGANGRDGAAWCHHPDF